jgi:hypothetical protein
LPFIPNLFERFFLLQLNKGPGPFLDIVEGSALRLVNAAIELEIFEILSKIPIPLSVREIASQGNASIQGLEVLLEAPQSLGYMKGVLDNKTSITEKISQYGNDIKVVSKEFTDKSGKLYQNVDYTFLQLLGSIS